jgi:hypothetical protein
VYELKLFFPNDDKLMSAHIKSAMKQEKGKIFSFIHVQWLYDRKLNAFKTETFASK